MTTQPTNIVVWTEIPVRNLDKAVDFYNSVFGWSMTIDRSFPEPMAVLGNAMAGAGGNLFEGEPASGGAGNRIHIEVADLAAAMDRAKAAGAKIGVGPVDIPPGKFTFIEDLDGNTIGLFEAKAKAA